MALNNLFWCCCKLFEPLTQLQIFWLWIYKCSWIIYHLMNIFPTVFEQIYFALLNLN
jgi:hypothetical protein